LASAAAGARPFTLGTESRTIVQPLFAGGQGTSVGGGGGGALGPVVAVTVGSVIVGSGAVVVVVSLTLDAPGEVATTVSVAELERSVSQIAETTPAPAATRKASSVGQIQSPGYQPSLRRQTDPRKATAPVVAGSRWPHSRQYSWPSP
jgi:hypothetical protein